jgi:hypothetical protein
MMNKSVRCSVMSLIGALSVAECSAQDVAKTKTSEASPAAEIDYMATPTEAPPTIDGALNDAVWQMATFRDDMTSFSQRLYLKKVKAKPATSFAISADELNLYIAMRYCKISDQDREDIFSNNAYRLFDTVGDHS